MTDASLTHKQPAELPPSPFIEGTTVQYAWDSVSITTLLECPQRYRYRIIDGWQSKNPNTAVALVFGILFHAGVEMWHRYRTEGYEFNDACDMAIKAVLSKEENGVKLVDQLPTDDEVQAIKEAQDEDDDGISLRNSKIRTRYYLMRALVWYFEHYKHDQLELFVMPTGKPAVELSFRVPVGIDVAGTELLLSGHIDSVVRFNGQLFVKDLKTTKSITRQWQAGFDLSHQMTGYTIGGNIALGEAVAGAVIDGVALQVGGVKYARHFTYRTQSQMAEYMRLLSYVADQAQLFAADDFYPLNTAACLFCEFKEVCRQPPEQRPRTLDYLFERKEAWNPLRSR